MIKKLMTGILTTAFLVSCMLIGIQAEEGNVDYSEEIRMFEDFYQHPDNYIFQDIDGNDITAYVESQKAEFEKDSYTTTDKLMQKVRSVMEADEEESAGQNRALLVRKTWSNLKVYYDSSRYCIYNVKGEYVRAAGEITRGSATGEIVDKRGASYSIQYAGNTISSNKKTITFIMKHYISATGVYSEIITTRHAVTIS